MKYGKILEQHISNYVARPNLAMDPEDVYMIYLLLPYMQIEIYIF